MNAGSWLVSDGRSHVELVAVGWTLLHFCWQGTALAVGYTVLDRITARAAASVRYAVALLVLAMMPLAVALTFTDQLQIANQAQQTLRVDGPDGPAEYVPFNVTDEAQDSSVSTASRMVASTLEAHQSLAARAEWALPYVDGLWLLGMLALAIRALGGWWQLHQVRRRAQALVPAAVQQAFERVCRQMRVGHRVVLRISDEVISPLAMGVWRATVILPVSAVVRLPMDELEAVLAHELGHIQRWDYLCNLAQTAVESVLFFHPSVWWLSRIVRERRELCCDAIAARSCSDPVVYARALLQLEEHRGQRRIELPLAMAIDGCGTSLLGRIKQVLGEDTAMESRMTSGVRVAAAAGVVMALLLSAKSGTALAAPAVLVAPAVQATPAASVPHAAPEAAPAALAAPEPAVIAKALPRAVAAPAPKPEPAAEARASRTYRYIIRSDDRGTRESREFAYSAPLMIQMDRPGRNDPGMPKGMAYLDQMKEAGYPLDLNNDLDQVMTLKSLGVTPEFAKGMSSLGLGKPTVKELIKLKALGVTPEYAAKLKQGGLVPKDFQELSTDKALGITPEYAAAMRLKGFTDLSQRDLVSLKAQGMTPEYAEWLKKQFPASTIAELRKLAVFHFDDKFLAQAKAHGFDTSDPGKLLKLKISGLLDE